MNFKNIFLNSKSLLNFSLSSSILSVTKLLSSIIVIRWIIPENMGIWNSLIVSQTYVYFMMLGTINGLSRDYPFYLGKGEKEKAENLASTCLFFVITISIVLFIVYIALLFIFKNTLSRDVYLSFISVGLLIIMQFYQNYLLITFRTNNAFDKLSYSYYIQSVFVLLSVLLVYYKGYNGFLIRAIFLTVSLLTLTHYFRPLKILPKFRKENFIELVKTGFPIFISAYLLSIVYTYSRVILNLTGGAITVGYFSPAFSIIAGLNVIPTSLTQFFFPKMSFKVGKGENPKQMWGWVWKLALIVIFINIPIIILGWIFLPDLIQHFFPAYVKGVFAAKMALISGTFSGAVIGNLVITSLKKYKWLYFLTGFKLIVHFGILYCFAVLINPLEGVAYGMVVADGLFLILSLTACYILLKKKL